MRRQGRSRACERNQCSSRRRNARFPRLIWNQRGRQIGGGVRNHAEHHSDPPTATTAPPEREVRRRTGVQVGAASRAGPGRADHPENRFARSGELDTGYRPASTRLAGPTEYTHYGPFKKNCYKVFLSVCYFDSVASFFCDEPYIGSTLLTCRVTASRFCAGLTASRRRRRCPCHRLLRLAVKRCTALMLTMLASPQCGVCPTT